MVACHAAYAHVGETLEPVGRQAGSVAVFIEHAQPPPRADEQMPLGCVEKGVDAVVLQPWGVGGVVLTCHMTVAYNQYASPLGADECAAVVGKGGGVGGASRGYVVPLPRRVLVDHSVVVEGHPQRAVGRKCESADVIVGVEGCREAVLLETLVDGCGNDQAPAARVDPQCALAVDKLDGGAAAEEACAQYGTFCHVADPAGLAGGQSATGAYPQA